MGTSFYNLVHPADLHVVVISIREMLIKGHTRTPYYRLIGLNKSVLWVQTEATTVNHTTKGQKGQYIICVHQLIGIQSERDSFVNGKNSALPACPASISIKQEVDDSSDAVRNSYSEVLQWLFRAQQRSKSPPGTLLFRTESNKNRAEYSGESTRYMTTMATRIETINYGSRNGITVSGTNDCEYNNSSLAHNGRGGKEFDPVASEIERCRFRTTSMRTNCSGGAAYGNTRDCTNHCFQTNFSESSTATVFNSVRLSSVPGADAYLLPPANISAGATTVTGTERNSSSMFSALSTTGAQYSRSLTCCDPHLNSNFTTATTTSSNTLLAFNTNSLHVQSNLPTSPVNCTTAHVKENNSSDMTETTEDWQMFAPFVAHDDVMQLSTDLQGLLPEFSFVDWIPSDPAPLPNLPTEERNMTLLGDMSIPMQMTFDRSSMYANSSISLLSKPNTFGFRATSWRQLQQQYQQRQQENMNAGITAAAPWLEVELTATCARSNDHPNGVFHRNNPATSIQ
uniref:PAS domain-containing protein n=1 Tax=Setaria digitata TaxID=48799 RepID=A0A915PML2_9BILA